MGVTIKADSAVTMPDNDLITEAEARTEPSLAGIATGNARLQQLISIASRQVQAYIHYTYTSEEITAGLPADLKCAVAQTVAYLWSRDIAGDKVDFQDESLGDYSYSKGRAVPGGAGRATVTRLDQIVGLLGPFRRVAAPQAIPLTSSAYLTTP